MLRNKHRAAAAVTTKQASLTMADSKPNHSSSLFSFSSPKFRFLTSKMSPFDSDFSLISPTSILEANPSIFSSKNPKPISYFPNPQRFHPPDAFGLADLVTHTDHSTKPVNKMVLFGSKLRVQIPSADFGIKTSIRYPPAHGQGQLNPCLQTKVLTGDSIPDQTEDYTCVISHGPNPTITHIFDNSVFVEKTPPCSVPLPPLAMEINNTTHFLSYCYTCNKSLDHKQDIYIYRGEKGFCSSECRSHEMLLDQMDT
ncbi:Protein MARD1 [Cardamine amara subsp. amara]|uniref:Protein MARD1 n=1 Tax=Cardamine amara subsp. amara TaxID=228776 RepID=A0ABD0ZSM4_CARAN